MRRIFFYSPKGEADAESRKVQRGGQWMTLQLHHWMAWKKTCRIRDSIHMYQQCNPLAALAQLYEDQAGGQLHHDSRLMTKPMSELQCWSNELNKYYFVYIKSYMLKGPPTAGARQFPCNFHVAIHLWLLMLKQPSIRHLWILHQWVCTV